MLFTAIERKKSFSFLENLTSTLSPGCTIRAVQYDIYRTWWFGKMLSYDGNSTEKMENLNL
jgi:hypothetical protein